MEKLTMGKGEPLMIGISTFFRHQSDCESAVAGCLYIGPTHVVRLGSQEEIIHRE